MFGEKADAGARCDIAQPRGEHLRGACGRRDQAKQHLDRGGLARAVRPEKAKDLAASDPQREVGDGGLFSELLPQSVRLNRVLVHPASIAICARAESRRRG